MTKGAERLLRYNRCPGSVRVGAEDMRVMEFWYQTWQAGRRGELWAVVRDFHRDAVTASGDRTGTDLELWVTGTFAGVEHANGAAPEDVEAHTRVGQWCEGCPGRGVCARHAREAGAKVEPAG